MVQVKAPAELLQSYGKLSLEDANEAETRLKLIDEILFGVLGWTHPDVKVETRVSEDGKTTFSDYLCTTAMTSFVIEAKRVGVSFDEVPNTRRTHLRGRIMSGVTGDTIRQAREYARRLSVGFASVTNGGQWIIFPVNRTDKVSFEDSSAIIFPSIQSILRDDYAEFHDLLSRQSIISGSLESELLGRKEDQLEERRLNRFFVKGFSRVPRLSLFPLIEDAVTTAFSEEIVSGNPDLLEKCYVKTPERIRFDARIKMHIAKRENVALRPPRRPMKQKDERALVEIIERSASRIRPVAVLTLGLVGAGKTTFLNYTRQIAAKDMFEVKSGSRTPYWLYVDFRDYSSSEAPSDFIFRNLRTHLQAHPFLSDFEQCIRPAYKEEVDALLRGPMFLLATDEAERRRRVTDLIMSDYAQTTPYVEKILKYIVRNAPVFLVIDNVDQFEEQATQARIFSEAMAISHRIGTNLIMTMRDATYVRHRSTPVFDAFDFDPIYIDAPKVEAVLSKRFFVARQLLAGRPGSWVSETGIRFQFDDLGVVMDLVQTSVLGTDVVTLLDVLATSDIRLALRMTREFLQYGYTATGRALEVYQKEGKYTLPPHEALRGIMLGNQTIYSEEYSVIGNPFDARLSLTHAQLLRLYVLTALVNMGAERRFQHLDGTEIRRVLAEIGFGDDVAIKVMFDLCKLRFAQTASQALPTFEASFYPTRLGGYVVRNLIANFMFLQNVIFDTFIAEHKVWEELRAGVGEIFAQRDRVKRFELRCREVRRFYEFMKRSYDVLREESVRRGLPREWCSHPLEAMENALEENLETALKSAKRQGVGSRVA